MSQSTAAPQPTADTGRSSVQQAIAEARRRYRAGAYAEAEALLASHADAVADDPAALRVRGMCRLRTGAVGEAIALLERAVLLAPGDPEAQLDLGIALCSAGRHREAATLFLRCAPRLPRDPAPPLNLAAARLALGDPAGALGPARRALLRAPQMAEAHYTLGAALLGVNRLAEAARAFTAALKRAPDLVEAWISLGQCRYRLDDPGGAETAMRRALALAPGHAAATANLAAFMRLRGDSEAGTALLRDAVARRPDAPEPRLNLAAALLQEERAEDALALLQGAPPADARARAHWQAQSVLAVLQLGRAAEARQLLQAIGETPPGLALSVAWRHVLLGVAEHDPAAARAAAGRMEALLGAPAEQPEHAIMAHFNLAKFWSQHGEPDRAFPLWVRGHALLRRIQPFSRADYQAFADASIAAFDRRRLHEGPRATNGDPAPVFVVGMPRSGTTLVEQILAAHQEAHGAGERNALAHAFHELGGAWESAHAAARVASQPAAALEAVAQRYLAELHGLAPDAQRIVDKMPGNFRYLGLIGLLLPGARIIHCVRDPRDIGLSIFTFRFFGYHPYAHDLADIGWYIGQHDRLMSHWRAALPNPILTLPLESWVGDFHATLRGVLAFLDLPYDAACERFFAVEREIHTVSRAQVREPVHGRGLGRWRAYAAQLQPLIAALRASRAENLSCATNSTGPNDPATS